MRTLSTIGIAAVLFAFAGCAEEEPYNYLDDPFWNRTGDINDAGEVVWQSGDYPWSNTRLLRRVRSPDLQQPAKLTPVSIEPANP